MPKRISAAFISSFLAISTTSGIGAAQPNVIIVGGGHAPESTQASIEKQVLALSAALEPLKPIVLFGGENQNARTVQVLSPVQDEIGDLLSFVFGERENVGVEYVASKVARSGPATKTQFLQTLAKSRASSDPTVVFGVGHGTSEKSDDSGRAGILFWGLSENKLNAQALGAELDKNKRPTAFFFGHCFSGAMLDLMYVKGEKQRGLAAPTRCGFASVPGDREAAGCTPDVHDPSSDAYMGLIAKAFETNPKISLTEAHFYAISNDPTLNVPLRSSDLWLEHQVPLVSRDAERAVSEILKSASPEEKRAFEQLGRTLEIDARGTLRDLMTRWKTVDAAAEQTSSSLAEFEEQIEHLRAALEDQVFEQWPELLNRFSKTSRKMIDEKSPELVSFIRARGELAMIKQLRAQAGRLANLLDEREREAAHVERMLRILESAVRKDRLPKQKRAELERLRECEALELVTR